MALRFFYSLRCQSRKAKLWSETLSFYRNWWCNLKVIHITRLSDIRLPTVETLGYYQPPTDFQSIQITCILPDRIGRKIRQFLILYPVLVSTTFKLQTLYTSNNYNINNISHFCWFCCKKHQKCCIIFSGIKI